MNASNAVDYQILNLTTKFYNDYPEATYPEIARKDARPYNCLLIESKNGYFICIPFRSHITHRNAFRFRNSNRSRLMNSGLDYSKVVIIKNTEYLSSTDAIVDQDEHNETAMNIGTITAGIEAYIDEYIEYCDGTKTRDNRYNRKYGFSTLPYFHNELGLCDRNNHADETIE